MPQARAVAPQENARHATEGLLQVGPIARLLSTHVAIDQSVPSHTTRVHTTRCIEIKQQIKSRLI
jgi:hypothetical protein